MFNKKNIVIFIKFLYFGILCIFGMIFGLKDIKAAIISDRYIDDDGVSCIEISDNNKHKNDQKVLQEALESGDNKPFKLIINKGNYTIKYALKIFDNTTIYAKGATITQKSKGRGLLMNCRFDNSKYGESKGEYGNCKNITIDGGTYVGQIRPSTKKELKDNGCFEGYSNFMFLHGKNITIKNLTIKNNYNGHLIELGGIKNSRIENCKLGVGDSVYIGEHDNEAIQLDNTYSVENSPAGYPFDDTPCKNITVKNCKIRYARGIGTNPDGYSVYNNIFIYNNDIVATGSEGINLYNCKNTRIVGNKIRLTHEKFDYQSSGCRLGISKGNDRKIKPNAVIAKNNIQGYMTGLNLSDAKGNGYGVVKIKKNKLKSTFRKKNALNISSNVKFKKLKEKKNKIL